MLNLESAHFVLDRLLDGLCVKLQLPRTQHKEAEGHYNAVAGWLRASGSPFATILLEIYAQGSLRIGTTVKPLIYDEFDLDLVLEMALDFRRIGNPVLVLDALESRLKDHGDYKKMVERKNRCIRLNYEGMHLDILPACPEGALGAGPVVVPDREAREWKASNPNGYAEWFEGKAKLALAKALEEAVAPLPAYAPATDPLRRSVQLLKRWRDIAFASQPDNAPISIVLTTLAGHHYSGEASVVDATRAILGGIVEETSGPSRLVVLNPANRREDLSERWDENPAAYGAFVEAVGGLRSTWEGLMRQPGIPEIERVLERLFGETLAKSVFEDWGREISKSRNQGTLRFLKEAGLLTTTLGPRTMPVPKNTFHGEKS